MTSPNGAPLNEPTGYDKARVAQLEPIRDTVEKLRLSPLRSRKITGVLNAIEMQIEDGGDSPEVNRLLLEALRAAIRHQVDERQSKNVFRSIDAFEKAEAKHWDQLRAGTLPPQQKSPWERLDDLMEQGYKLLKARRQTDACDRWLEAWELVKQLARPEWKTTEEFDRAHRGRMEYVFNWCQDMEEELSNAGLDNPIYHEHRLRYAREFLARFPAEDADHYVNFMRAEGEALWRLGRQDEADAVYASLVEQYPDEAWGYIGWADQYWLYDDSPKEYEKAEAIMQRALERPNLTEPGDVLERIEDMHMRRGRPQESAAVPQQTEAAPPDISTWMPGFRALMTRTSDSPPAAKKLARNALCWCGSGKKYKKCHLQADEAARPQ